MYYDKIRRRPTFVISCESMQKAKMTIKMKKVGKNAVIMHF